MRHGVSRMSQRAIAHASREAAQAAATADASVSAVPLPLHQHASRRDQLLLTASWVSTLAVGAAALPSRAAAAPRPRGGAPSDAAVCQLQTAPNGLQWCDLVLGQGPTETAGERGPTDAAGAVG